MKAHTFFGLFLLLSQTAFAQTLPERFHRMVDTQGVSGYEADVRELVRAQLPSWVKPKIDEIGNLTVSVGRGNPHTALIAALDENGYVVSRITDDGYLRLHRHGPASSNVLRDQFMVGQPVVIRSADGRMIPGVTATPSLHMRRLLSPAEISRIRSVGDLWVDVGATSAAAVAQLGIRVLDPVNLRERAQTLAKGQEAGVNTQLRAGAQALIELLRGLPSEPELAGTVTFAWTVQSQFNERGLARLAQTIHPTRAFVIGGTVTAPKSAPSGWNDVPIVWKNIPSLFDNTPVEVVDVAHITALARELAAETGLKLSDNIVAEVKPVSASPLRVTQDANGPYAILKPLIESYGVSGHEAPVRELVRTMLPAWAKPTEDEQGNLSFSFGQGGKELLFVAHLDETGFEITNLRAEGTAAIRDQGGMYLSLYEAQPVWVHTAKGKVPAVIAPRPNYTTAPNAQPDLANLLLYFGTNSAGETQALGVAVGQSVTVRKQFVELAAPRATGRAVDDRAGITALLLALKMVDPTKLKNRITVAFSVGEEVGLTGSRALAKRFHPQYAFAIDTFVSTDTPTDSQYLAYTPLGHGPVLRSMDNLILTPAGTIDRIVQLARAAKIPLQIGVTQGGVDSFAFSAGGAIDVGLSWPGRYSHSSVEIIDQRDLVKLSEVIAMLMQQF